MGRARIRTIKPELFRHEELFQLEQATSLPMRIAWAGLFTVCDRSGRFQWKPKNLKLDILPYDEMDFGIILDAFQAAGFIVRYTHEGRIYGCIPSWQEHQIINNREELSKLPGPNDEGSEVISRVPHASLTRAPRDTDLLKGKGREGEGNGREGNVPNAHASAHAKQVKEAFFESFRKEFGRDYPGWGRKENSQLSAWLKSVSLEKALELVHLYPKWNDPWVTKVGHPFGVLVSQYVQLDGWAKSSNILIHKIARGKAVERVDIKRAVDLEEMSHGLQHRQADEKRTESLEHHKIIRGILPGKPEDPLPRDTSDPFGEEVFDG